MESNRNLHGPQTKGLFLDKTDRNDAKGNRKLGHNSITESWDQT